MTFKRIFLRSRRKAVENCAAEWIGRRDAGLDAAGERALQAWLAARPENRAEFARLESAWAVLDGPRETDRANVVMEGLTRRSRWRRRRQSALAAAASLALLGGSWWLASPSSPEAHEPGPATLGLAGTEQLPDGTLVELRKGAEIAVAYEAGSRRVMLLRGEAHFLVYHDLTRPFVVQAGRVEVRAVGTAFAVRHTSEEVEVLVTEGQVAVDDTRGRDAAGAAVLSEASGEHESAVQASDRTAGGPGLVLSLGQRVVLPVNTREEAEPEVTPMSDADYSERLAWRGQRLEFSGTSLTEAVKQFNTRNRVQLVLSDPAAGELQVSGIFRAHNVEGFVRLIEGTFGITAEREGNERIRLDRAR